MENKISFYFEGIKDPRVAGRCAHLLSGILIIGVCTYITGGTDYRDMYLSGRKRAEELKGSLLALSNGTPSADTYERVFARVESGALKNCSDLYGKEILGCPAEKQMVLSGKKLKGVSPSSKGNTGFYILNVRVSENRICVGQEKVNGKSNGITAIPEVLKSLDIEDAIVSMDAIGTQVAIARQIREQKGHYLLSVKGNQNDLPEDIQCAFKTHSGYDRMDNSDNTDLRGFLTQTCRRFSKSPTCGNAKSPQVTRAFHAFWRTPQRLGESGGLPPQNFQSAHPPVISPPRSSTEGKPPVVCQAFCHSYLYSHVT